MLQNLVVMTYLIDVKNQKGQYFVFNAHGDVVQLTDASGNVVKNYHYDAFGVEGNIDKDDSNPFRYCAEYYDKETGTIYLRAKYYNPSIRRFITQDPIRDWLNWYTYCGNSPVMWVDPSGLKVIQHTHKDGFTMWIDNSSIIKYKKGDDLITSSPFCGLKLYYYL